jgi:hypothetical protein
MASSSSRRADQLKETLKSLESFQLSDSIQDSFNNRNLDPTLIQRYKEARDLYLRRHIQSIFMAHVETYDGHSIQEFAERPSEEEEEDAKEQLAKARSAIQMDAQELHQQTLELEQKHRIFCSRREELRKMIEDMEEQDDEKNGDANESVDVDMAETDDDEEDVDDDALAQEEERLTMLQQKKAQLEVKLNMMRQEIAAVRSNTEKNEAIIAELWGGEGPSSPTSLKEEVEETQKKTQEYTDIKDFYDGLRGVMEELNGLRILEVTNTTNNGENKTEVNIRVQVLEKHDIKITMRSSHETPEEFRVSKAEFLTSTVVRAPVDAPASTSANELDEEEDGQNKVLKLTIPPLDDLVKLSARLPPGEDLRFLVREAMNRIQMIQNRVVELAVLHNNVLTKIGSFQHNNDGFGGEEQEVVCSLNECITVVLRLTADCPLVPGSVYISQMVGVAGWDDATVMEIQEAVSRQEFKSPWDLIQAIQSEISRLEDAGLSLPKTPTLPLRRKRT